MTRSLTISRPVSEFLAVMVGITLCSTSAWGANLLVNPDFETGDLSSWTIADPSPALDQVVIAAPAILSPPLTGFAYKIRPGSTSPDAGISQVISTVAGQMYAWSIDTAMRQLQGASGTVETFELRLDGTTVASVTHADTDGPTTDSFSGMYLAPGSTVEFRLVFNRNANPSSRHPQWFADNAVFDVPAIPEPSRAVLLVVGIGAGLIRRRR